MPSFTYDTTFFIADKKLNEFMRACDLRPDGKWYVTPWNISMKLEMEGHKLKDIINRSFDSNKDFWIPAIKVDDFTFSHPTVKVLSDGTNTITLGKDND